MFSLSTTKRKAAKAAAAQQKQQQQERAAASVASFGEAGSPSSGNRPPAGSSRADELGRVLSGGGWRARSKSEHRSAAASSLPPTPPLSSTKAPPVPLLQPQWHFSPTLIPPAPSRTADNLPWGLIPTRPDVVLGLADVAPAVAALTTALGRRALDTPLLFSSLALDVSAPTIAGLIETFLATLEPRPGTSQDVLDRAWSQELTFAGERELAWVLRWVLARALRLRPASGAATSSDSSPYGLTIDRKRGLVDTERYLTWKEREQASAYPLVHWHAFTAALGPELQPVFNNLFSLLSSLAAHSHIGGCTPSVLGSLFGPLLFGVPASSPVYETHAAFSRSALATEHLLLAFIRSQAHASASHAGALPSRLQTWISGYPSMITTAERALALTGVRPGVKTIRAEGLRRDVRAYAPELFRSAESWPIEMELAEGAGRPDVLRTWVERVIVPSHVGSAIHPTSGPRFAADFKRRLHIPAHLPARHAIASGPGALSEATLESSDDDEANTSFRSMSEKQWGDFLCGGFDGAASPSSASLGSVEGKGGSGGRARRAPISKQLEFDLTEGARKAHHEKRDTLSWTDFSSAGFSRTEATLSENLAFSKPIEQDIQQWPEHREEVRRRLKKLQKDLPSFDYNTRPRPVGELLLEEPFVDCWADLLISAGWMDRSDMTLRECNWAIVSYRAAPPAASRQERRASVESETDPRTDQVYFSFEEIVPVEYQARLTAVKKPSLSLFSTRRVKKAVPVTALDSHGGLSQRDREEDFEASVLRGRPTKLLSLTSTRGQESSQQAVLMRSPERPATQSPSISSPSTTRSTPQGRSIHPSRSASEFNKVSKATTERRPLSPISAQKVTSKKAARRIQGESPFDPAEMDLEMRLASSSPNGTLRRAAAKTHGREPSRDDLWIDIFVSNAAKGKLAERTPIRHSPTYVSEPFVPPPVPAPKPPQGRPLPERLVPLEAFPTQTNTRFDEGTSSEVGSLGTSTVVSDPSPSPLAPAIFVTATSPSTASSDDFGQTARPIIVDRIDSELVGESDLLEESAAVGDGLTKSERLRLAVAAATPGEYDDSRNSVASDFTQADSDRLSYLDEEATPRTSVDDPAATVDDLDPSLGIPPLSTTSSYIHGQPLHNLIEEEEEE